LVLFIALIGGLFPLWETKREPVVYAGPDEPIAISTFDTDDEGWTTTPDARCIPQPCYAASDGNRGFLHIPPKRCIKGFLRLQPPFFLFLVPISLFLPESHKVYLVRHTT